MFDCVPQCASLAAGVLPSAPAGAEFPDAHADANENEVDDEEDRHDEQRRHRWGFERAAKDRHPKAHDEAWRDRHAKPQRESEDFGDRRQQAVGLSVNISEDKPLVNLRGGNEENADQQHPREKNGERLDGDDNEKEGILPLAKSLPYRRWHRKGSIEQAAGTDGFEQFLLNSFIGRVGSERLAIETLSPSGVLEFLKVDVTNTLVNGGIRRIESECLLEPANSFPCFASPRLSAAINANLQVSGFSPIGRQRASFANMAVSGFGVP